MINKAIGSAVLGAVKTIFPPTLFFDMLKKAANSKGTLGFPPVKFANGTDQWQAGEEAELTKLAEFMRGKPAISLNVCGVVTAEDLREIAPDAHAAMVATANAQKQAMSAAKSDVTADKSDAADKPDTTDDADTADKSTTQPAPSPASEAPKVDVKKVREQLRKLASDRGLAVKNYLVKEQQIADQRLFECRPKVELAGDGGPRVELSW